MHTHIALVMSKLKLRGSILPIISVKGNQMLSSVGKDGGK